jgi:hypothetical protein
MEPLEFDELAFIDHELNKLIDSRLKTEDIEDVEIGIFEKIVFSEQERTYSELNKRTTKQVVKALKKTENGRKRFSEKSLLKKFLSL